MQAVASVILLQPILLLSGPSSLLPVQVHLASRPARRSSLLAVPALLLMLPAVLWRAPIQALWQRLCCIPCEI